MQNATAFCIQNNLGLPRSRDVFDSCAHAGTMPDCQAYAISALKLINRHASVDCNFHVGKKPLACRRQWLTKHKIQHDSDAIVDISSQEEIHT